MRSTTMITQPDFFLSLIGAFSPWNLRPLSAFSSNTTIQLSVVFVRLGQKRTLKLLVGIFLCFLDGAKPNLEPHARFEELSSWAMGE